MALGGFVMDPSQIPLGRRIIFPSPLKSFRFLPTTKALSKGTFHFTQTFPDPILHSKNSDRDSKEIKRLPSPPCRTFSSVSVQPTFRRLPSFVVNGWFGMAFGILLAVVCQILLSKFKNQFGNDSLIKQPRSTVSVGSSSTSGEDGETIEWVNMCWRKIWRVYQRGLERWLAGVLQPVFDKVVKEGNVPQALKEIKIVELTFDHQAPYFTNLRRRTSRKDSDLSGVVDVRYTGGARMLLMLEVGGGRWLMKIPVLVSDLDLECQLWLKIRLAPLTPYVGTLSFAFVGPPNIKVQLAPYNSVRLMHIPVLQNFLTRLLTKLLPGLMTLPKRLEIKIPPAITAVAEAAVGRDAVMKAVASAVLQADALEHSLLAVLPLGPQSAAGGITLPKSFQGELSVALIEGRDLPVWGFPWQSNPYCRITLGKQAVTSKRENETGTKGRHRYPIWNQEFEFLVENLQLQTLEVFIKDSPITGRPEVGKVSFSLSLLPRDGSLSIWLPIEQVQPGQEPMGELHLDISYKPFVDDEDDSGYRETEKLKKRTEGEDEGEITDIKSAAAASSKAAAAASAAFSAIAITRAAAARAANRAKNAALAAKKITQLGDLRKHEEESDDEDSDVEEFSWDDATTVETPVSQNGSRPPDEDLALEKELQELSNSDIFDAAIKIDGLQPKRLPQVDLSPLMIDPPNEMFREKPLHVVNNHSIEEKLPEHNHSTKIDENAVKEMTTDRISHSKLDVHQKAMEGPWYSNIIRKRSPLLETIPSENRKIRSKKKKKDRVRWWMWLTSFVASWRSESKSESKPSLSKDRKKDEESSPLVPVDLPLEEIAKEVVKLKIVTEKDEQERWSRVYSEAAKQGDRKWLMLLCFLIVLSIAMLSIVAIRIGPI